MCEEKRVEGSSEVRMDRVNMFQYSEYNSEH